MEDLSKECLRTKEEDSKVVGVMIEPLKTRHDVTK